MRRARRYANRNIADAKGAYPMDGGDPDANRNVWRALACHRLHSVVGDAAP